MTFVIGFSMLTFCITYGCTYYLRLKASRFRIIDRPNKRSLHATPIPRTGGLAILVGLAVGWLGSYTIELKDKMTVWIMSLTFIIGLISFWDDRYGLSPFTRIGIHGLIAIIWIKGSGWRISEIDIPYLDHLSLGVFSIPITLLFMVWMINLYNFMDGMDGFSGGMTLFGFGFLGYLGWMGGEIPFAYMAFTIAVVSAGFLMHNFPPAKIFMGDVGSIPLGFLAAAFSIMGIQKGLFGVWVPILVFSPFIIDATITLGRRLLNRKRVWQAHREHYYQRMVIAGWGHRRTVLFEYLLMMGGGVSALVYVNNSPTLKLAILVFWILIYMALAYGVRVFEMRQKKVMT